MRLPFGLVWARSDRVRFKTSGGSTHELVVRVSKTSTSVCELNAAGYQIRLVPTAQGTHCKDWRLLELWRTDIFRRAIPWSRLLVNGATQGMSLNLSRTERLRGDSYIRTLLAGGVGICYGIELAWTCWRFSSSR